MHSAAQLLHNGHPISYPGLIYKSVLFVAIKVKHRLQATEQNYTPAQSLFSDYAM